MKSLFLKIRNLKGIAMLLASIAIILAIAFTIASCEKSINTKVPYGSINGDYKVSGDITLTNKSMYDLLRFNGKEHFTDEIEKIILKDYIEAIDLNNEDEKEHLDSVINNIVFSTDDIDAINEMNVDTRNTMIDKYVDTLYGSGIDISNTDIVVSSTGVSYPDAVKKYYELSSATYLYGKAELEKIVDQEFIDDEENDYYISLEDVEKYHDDTYRYDQDYLAIIVGYNTKKEADAAASTLVATKEGFRDLYKAQFPFDTTTTDEDFIVNNEVLATYNEGLANFIKTTIEIDETTNEGMTLQPKQFGDKNYLIYVEREEALFEDSWEEINDGLSEDAIKATQLYKDVKADLFEATLTPAFSESKLNEEINDLIEEDKITIYDPVFALQFSAKYSTYKNLTAKSDTVVAKVNDTEITPNALFDLLKPIFAKNIEIDYFINGAIANSKYMDELTSDDKDAAKEELDAEIKNYEKDVYLNDGISKQFSKSQFLSLKYGHSTEADVLKYYFYPKYAKEYLTSDYDANYLALLEQTGKNYYDNYYNLDIKHVLLSVDYNLDGTMDDPNAFMSKLSDADKTAFSDTIIKIYSYVYFEATYLNMGVADALDSISKRFNANGEIKFVSDTTAMAEFNTLNPTYTATTWEDVKTEIKNFNITMKVEDLGNIDTTTGSNYVAPFTTHVIEMYEDLKAEARADTFVEEGKDESTMTEDEIKEFVESKDFIDTFEDLFEELLEEEENLEKIDSTTTFEELCLSQFGFHMLLATDGSIPESARFTYDNDYKQNSDDEHRVFEKIEIEFNGTKETVDGYSDTNYASINQIKVYLAEKDEDDGVTSLRNQTETIIENFYSAFETRYTSEIFTKFVAINNLKIDRSIFDLETLNIMERTLNEYKSLDNTNYENWKTIW